MINRFVFTLILCLSAATIAHADPLTLTSGSFYTYRTPDYWSNHGEASGPRVSFSGGSSFDCGVSTLMCGGSSSSGFLSSLVRPNALGAIASIDGVTYNAVVISFGFSDTTVTGSINVFADRDVPPGTPPLFSVDFIGYGFVTVFADPERRSTTTHFTILNTPEPASLFLIGLGIAGLAVKLKLRHT